MFKDIREEDERSDSANDYAGFDIGSGDDSKIVKANKKLFSDDEDGLND